MTSPFVSLGSDYTPSAPAPYDSYKDATTQVQEWASSLGGQTCDETTKLTIIRNLASLLGLDSVATDYLHENKSASVDEIAAGWRRKAALYAARDVIMTNGVSEKSAQLTGEILQQLDGSDMTLCFGKDDAAVRKLYSWWGPIQEAKEPLLMYLELWDSGY